MDWLAEDTTTTIDYGLPPWKVVIVDDDDEVHKITTISLNDFEFEHKKLEFVHLYSGKEAEQYFSQHNDIALVLLDVVMESDHAGLEVVKYIRETLGNYYTRIVLRTGQPGTAPANEVIKNYDIDGYNEKTKVTINTLNQTIYTALRSYRDLTRIQNYQRGLERLISAINDMTQIDSVMELSNAVLQQVKTVLDAENAHFLIKDSAAFTMMKAKDNHWNFSINETQATFVDESTMLQSSQPIVEYAQQCFLEKKHIVAPPYYCFYYHSKRGTDSAFVFKCGSELSSLSHKLIKLFSINIVLTVENLLIEKHSNH